MRDQSSYGLRGLPVMSARAAFPTPPFLEALVAHNQALLDQPFSGITSDGMSRPGLFALGPTGVSTKPIAEAAQAFLATLSAEQAVRATQPIDSLDWRRWFNVHMFMYRHGLLLDDLSVEQRQAALRLLSATTSTHGFETMRGVMKLNDVLAEITGSTEEYGEWLYFVTIFGDPASGEPWGWQLDGHHLNLHCVIVGDRLVMTPTFVGSEPCHAVAGPHAGTRVFEPEEANGLALVRALDADQAATAVLHPSIMPGELPEGRKVFIDGEMLAGAFQDNRVISYEGIRGDQLTDGQRSLLLELVAGYVGWSDEGHAEVKMREVAAHLDETHFCWMGATDDVGPFYYRVQSPVVLIEFDHEEGVVFDNDFPSRVHAHSIIRTPNGGDYGVDLLRQHYGRFEHRNGHHIAR